MIHVIKLDNQEMLNILDNLPFSFELSIIVVDGSVLCWKFGKKIRTNCVTKIIIRTKVTRRIANISSN